MQFPYTATYDELAALPGAAEAFGWDDSMIDEDDPDLASFMRNYSEAFTSSDHLLNYLASAGYALTDDGISIRDENSLRLAHAIFCAVFIEYELPDAHPTWDLFHLGGDDDVDYCGTQPSCLTSLLILNLPKE